MNPTELKSCPFCGSKECEVLGNTCFWATCPKCRAEGPGYLSRVEAVAAWNARAQAAPPEAAAALAAHPAAPSESERALRLAGAAGVMPDPDVTESADLQTVQALVEALVECQEGLIAHERVRFGINYEPHSESAYAHATQALTAGRSLIARMQLGRPRAGF